jgi:Flp pilus assembly protein TadG
VQLLEFAISLPLLMVIIVGIFDFSGAFNVKQKLNNAVREGARAGSILPTNDLSNTNPTSVTMVRDVVDSYLTAAKVSDCGLGSPVPSGTLVWVATGNSGCAGTFTLTIDRGYGVPTAIGATTVYVLNTHVLISYPYQWHFNNVIKLLIPGAGYAGSTQITTDAIFPNID